MDGPATAWPEELPVDGDLTMHQVDSRDAADIFAAVDANRDYLRRWLPWVDGTATVADSARFVRAVREQATLGKAVHFVLSSRRRLVGLAGFAELDPASGTGTLGFWLVEDQQRKGLMTGACRKLIREGCHHHGVTRVQMFCDGSNMRSRAVAARLRLDRSCSEMGDLGRRAGLLRFVGACDQIVVP